MSSVTENKVPNSHHGIILVSPKAEATNWIQYEASMKLILNNKKLWYLLDDDNLLKTENDLPILFEAMVHDSDKCRAIVIESVHEDNIEILQDADSPKMMWEALRKAHQNKNGKKRLDKLIKGALDSKGDPSDVLRETRMTLGTQTPTATPLTVSSSFFQLPVEIIERIVDLVRIQAYDLTRSERDDLHARRAARGGRFDREDGSGTYDNDLHDQEPLLNDFQALATLNRALHQICAPLLWKTLSFPTMLSCPLSFWTERILPRNGSHVQCLTWTIATGTLTVPWHLACQTNIYDNMDIQTFEGQTFEGWNKPMSPQGVISVLERCPNIRHLKLDFPEREPTDSEQDNATYAELVHRFVLRLTPAISRLAKLQHLELNEAESTSLPGSVIIALIANLPLLESLEFHGVEAPVDAQVSESLGFHISQLKRLSRLALWYNSAVDHTWLRSSWPLLLTDLSLAHNPNLTPTNIHPFINHIAPNVTKLEYGWNDRYLGIDLSLKSIKLPSFQLEHLTELTLLAEMRLLAMFRDCKALVRLTHHCYDHKASDNCLLLVNVLSPNPWPLLKIIELQGWVGFTEKIIPNSRMHLERHCKQIHVQLLIG